MTTLNASTFPQTGYTPTIHVQLPTRQQLVALRDEFLRVGRKESAAALDNVLDVILTEAEEAEQIELCNRIVEANAPAFEAMRVGLNKIADMPDSADGACMCGSNPDAPACSYCRANPIGEMPY